VELISTTRRYRLWGIDFQTRRHYSCGNSFQDVELVGFQPTKSHQRDGQIKYSALISYSENNSNATKAES